MAESTTTTDLPRTYHEHPLARARSERSKILDLDPEEDPDRDQKKIQKEQPPNPLQGEAGTSPAMVVPVEVQATLVAVPGVPAKEPRPKRGSQKAAPTDKIPDILSSLSGHVDVGMWVKVFETVKASSKPFILEIVEVWDAYRLVFPLRRILDHKGADKIADALRLGYSVDDLKDVPGGAKLSTFHMGTNDSGKTYVDPETLYRDAKAIDGHVRRLREGPEKPMARPQTGHNDYGGKSRPSTRDSYGGHQDAMTADDYRKILRGGGS